MNSTRKHVIGEREELRPRETGGRFSFGGIPDLHTAAHRIPCPEKKGHIMRLAFVALGLTVLAGCDIPPPQPNACEQATTYGEMFGTPENKGPCWGTIISAAQGGEFRTYMMQLPVPGYVIGDVTYQGSTLIQAGVSRVR